MGVSLWDQVWLPLLIGVAIQIVVAALCFLSVRLWNCLIQQINAQTAVGERDHDQPRPVVDVDAAAHANALPDLEMGTVNAVEGGDSKVLSDLDVGMANGESFGEGDVPRRATAAVGQIRHSKEATVSGSTPWTARAPGWAPLTPRMRPLWRTTGGRKCEFQHARGHVMAAASAKKWRNVALYFTPVLSFLCAELVFFESI